MSTNKDKRPYNDLEKTAASYCGCSVEELEMMPIQDFQEMQIRKYSNKPVEDVLDEKFRRFIKEIKKNKNIIVSDKVYSSKQIDKIFLADDRMARSRL